VLTLATGGLITVWVAIMLRAPLATTRIERLLLAALASMSLLTTLFNPYVADWTNGLIGVGGGDLLRHIASIVTSAAMVAFALAPSRPQHIRWWLWTAVATLAAMMAMRAPSRFSSALTDATATPYNGAFGDLSIVYYTLLAGYCTAALVMTIVVFSKTASKIDVFNKYSLRMHCVSFAFNALAWIVVVVGLLTNQEFWTRYIPAMDGLNALFMAAGLLIALAGSIATRRRLATVTGRLNPLWQALTTSVPDVVLHRGSDAMRRYDIARTTVELRDCLLILGAYVTPTDIDAARRQISALPTANGHAHTEAMVCALSLRTALANKSAGKPPGVHKVSLMTSNAATLDDELTELVALADAYRDTAHLHTVQA
jgi:hypothetical protein